MEKQTKPVRPGGKKRQRKISLPGNASDPKHLKLDVSNNLRLKDTAPAEKKQAQVKPKKSAIKKLPEGVTMLQSVLPPKLTSKAKPLIGSKKDKIKTANALIESTNAINSSVTSIMESAKAYLDDTGNQIDSMLSTNQAKMSKKLKTPKANINRSPKLKSKSILAPLSEKKKRKSKVKVSEKPDLEVESLEASSMDIEEPLEIKNKIIGDVSLDEKREKFPILKDTQIIEKFLKVPMSNNQKGRIRQAVKLSLQGTENNMFPEIINGKIQAILSSSVNLTASELRRIRILYNMLKTAIEAPSELLASKSPKKKKADKKKDKKEGEDGEEKKVKKEEVVQKVKGPKRYVVFLGNLPLNINKEMIMDHFTELNEQIKDIRLPKLAEGTKSAIAYVELSNKPSYELALSKHHSMLGNKRIKVLYTAQKNSKISRSEAKGKSAKLIALQKSGKLVGSTPLSKKRSHRRAIMKKAKAKEAATA